MIPAGTALLVVGLVAGLAAASAEPVATVRIVVEGVRNDRGHVRIDLCTRETFLTGDCRWHVAASAKAGRLLVDISDVPPGVYAAQAFHDERDLLRVERGGLGLPKEGVGFSRDAPILLGPPRFARAAFTVTAAGGSTTLRLRYLSGG